LIDFWRLACHGLFYQFEFCYGIFIMSPARHSPAKSQQLIVVCDSAAVSAGDISEVLAALQGLSRDRTSALRAEGTVTLIFDGYDSDPRELDAIPEVRAWFATLFKAWPYWSFFANRTDQTVALIISLLLPGEQVKGEEVGMVGWCFDIDELSPLLLKMFGFQNELIESLDIDEDVNERSSADFIEAVQAFLN
jgi:hypothetical protein